jgi:hypothetical protein
MKQQNDMALKEWAVTCQALEEGKQTILLRKVGVTEEGGESNPENPEFFLYPTFEHENPEDIKADWRPRLAKIEKEARDPKHVHFHLYGCAEAVIKITDLEMARRLAPFTILSDAAVENKFNSGDWQGLYLYLVRMYSLAVPMDLPRKPTFEACKSWVPLKTSLFTVGAYPVLPDGVWPYTRDKILSVAQSD